jgi:ubiquinone/menaquinone biosynthesis C-methylase UbiE
MDHWIRPSVEHTGELVTSLGLQPGEAVADIGTGVGYLLPHLVARVGPQGSVVGVDVYPDFVSKARDRVKAAGWRNVRVVLGTEHDPRLPPAQIDAAILLDTYHHLNYPDQTLRHVRQALKPHGRLIIIDYYRSRRHPGTTDEDLRKHIRIDRDEVVSEVQAEGFQLARRFDHLPHEYVLIFEKL